MKIVVAKIVVAWAVSLALNVVALSTLDWSVQQSVLPPAGEVSVVQLSDQTELPVYAQIAHARPRLPGPL